VEDNRFWKGQNIFVALLGGGVVVVPEHSVYGSILIVLGALGFIHSVRVSPMKSLSSLAWIPALLLTWIGIGYDYYDRHALPQIPEFDEPQINSLHTGYGFRNGDCFVNANGDTFWPFRDLYKISMACLVYTGKTDLLDAPDLQVGSEYEIVRGDIDMVTTVSPIIQPLLPKAANYYILLVPYKVSISQLTSLRVARALGVKIKFAGASAGVGSTSFPNPK
jgi:hypothetical protein